MHVGYDYRYVIACSSLPGEFKGEFRKLVRGRVNSTFDRRTGARYPVSAETQCRRVAALLQGFEVLRAGGFAPQTPWNLQGKHLRFLIARWSAQELTSPDLAEKLVHWRQFVLWINKRALLALLSAPLPTGAPRVGKEHARSSAPATYGLPDIPVLTHDKAMAALTEQRGNLRKAARALGTTTHSVCQAVTEGRPRQEPIPGLKILT